MNLIGTIKIETPRLILRKITENDSEDMFYNWANDNNVTKYLNWHTHKNINTSMDIIKMWIEQYNSPFFYQWAIELKEIKKVIGTISIFNIRVDNKSGEIGYCLGQKFWNKGYMTEACHSVFDFAFNIINFDVLYGKHHIENPKSGRVMIHNKMKLISTIEEYSEKEKENIKLNFYQVKKEDWI